MQVPEDDASMCMFRGCTESDLLPARCQKCRKSFCTAHISYFAHQCTEHRDVSTTVECPICSKVVVVPGDQSPDFAVGRHIENGCQPPVRGKERLNFCSAAGCTRNEMQLMTCHRCGASFCMHHRHPTDHRCAASTPPPQQSLPSGQRRQSPAPTGTTGPAPSSRPHHLSQLRFRNTPSTALGVKATADAASYVVLPVFAEPSAATVNPAFLRFTRKWVVGRALDSICQELDLPNTNASATDDADKWHLHLIPRCMLLPTSMALEDCCSSSGTSHPTEALLLTRGPTIPAGISKEIAEAKSISSLIKLR